MTEGETRMCVASTVCEMRNSSRHFRIVLPGWSDKAISPAIFSRSGNSMERARSRGLYKRVEDAIGGRRTWPKQFIDREDRISGSLFLDTDDRANAYSTLRSPHSHF